MSPLTRKLHRYLDGRFVLVIEPSRSYRLQLKNFFQNLRIKNLKFVTSADEARREMASAQIGFFIAERNMPSKSGLQFCRELRREGAHKTTPFLLLGAENFRHDIILASEGGVDGYLLKPFSYEDFLEQINLIVSNTEEPSSLQKILDRADAHILNGETWVAEALLMEAQNIKPQSARAMCGFAKIAMSEGDYNKAKEKLNAAISYNPNYLETYQYLLKLAQATKDQSYLLESAKILLDMSPDNPRYPLIIADLMLQLGDMESTAKFLDLAVKKSPLLRFEEDGLHPSRRSSNQAFKTQKNLTSTLDLESFDADILGSIAKSYVKLNLPDEALKALHFALKLNERDPKILYQMGLVFEKVGNNSAAVRSLRLAIAADPLSVEARKKLQELQARDPSNSTNLATPLTDQLEPSTLNEKKGA